MCLRCWSLVPQGLRRRINELWRESGGDILRLAPEYFDAVREAEEAVRAQLEVP